MDAGQYLNVFLNTKSKYIVYVVICTLSNLSETGIKE